MASLIDFTWIRNDTGFLTVVMSPPVNISGRSIQFDWTKRADGSGYFSRYCASGFNGVSGITVIDGNGGSFNVAINPSDTSGLDFGNYFHRSKFTDAPALTVSEGHILLEP